MMSRNKIFILVILGLLVMFGLSGALTGAAVSEPAPATPLDPTTLPKYTSQLVIPPALAPTVKKHHGQETHEYTISMDRFSEQILPDGFPQTPVFGYGGMIQTPGGPTYLHNSPGPTIEAVRDVPIKVHYVNNLNGSSMLPVDPTIMWANPNNMEMPMAPFPPFPPGFAQAQEPIPAVVHLHGGEVRSDSDGGPEAWYTATGLRGPKARPFDEGTNNTVTFDYPNAQEPTTLFYHDHTLGMTRINLLSGLAAFYILRDREDPVARQLPSGKYEVPIAIQDRSFNTDGTLNLPHDGVNPDIHPYWIPEFFGDTIMVNGKTWPNLDVEPRQYRLRLLNGSNARFYNLSLSSGQSFTQIGSDGGYLPQPADMTSLLLAPGERADILVDFSAAAPGTKIVLNNDANAPFPDGDPVDPNTTGQIMQFTVAGDPGEPETSMLSLASVMKASAKKNIPKLVPDSPGRTLTLNEAMSAIDEPLMVLLNGQRFDAPATEMPKVGATEDWTVVNMSADTHPIHLHLVQFQVVSRQKYDFDAYTADWTALNGMPPLDHPTAELPVTPYLLGSPAGPDPGESGWKDTVRMNPGEVTVIRVRVAPQDTRPASVAPDMNAYPFDPTFGPGYVWHCHIVDHEDNEMMRPEIIVQSVKPMLKVQHRWSYWASYADFRHGRLTEVFTLDNRDGGTANDIQVTGAPSTRGVSVITPLPIGLGSLAAGDSTEFSLKFQVPRNVWRFRTMVLLSAKDTSGNSYTYP